MTEISSAVSLTSVDLNDIKVVVHPLVLLSVVDHYQRVAKATKKRVVGALLGELKDNELHITNSFAVPFEEDSKDSGVNFLDGLYYQQLAYMFKKINTKEKFVGWYSSGNTISPGDLRTHKIFYEFAGHTSIGVPPVFCLVDVSCNTDDSAMPVKVYYQTNVPCSHDEFLSTFRLLARCEIKGSEAEEVAVEHLLREIKETHAISFKGQLLGHYGAIQKYQENILQIQRYLKDVGTNHITPNQSILTGCQDFLTLLPSFQSNELLMEGQGQLSDETSLLQYVGNLTMAVIGLHDILENRANNASNADKPKQPRTKQIVDHTS